MDPLAEIIAEEGAQSYPAVDKEPLTPVEYVKHWIKVYGNFGDGKIDKSRQMKRDDLSKADAEFLLGHGITKSQIAQQYGIPTGSMTYIFQQLGVKVKAQPPLSKEEFRVRLQSEQKPAAEVSADAIDESRIVWFDKPGSFIRASTEPRIRITKSGIMLNAAFMQQFGETDYVRLGIDKASCRIVVAKADNDALQLRWPSGVNNGTTRILRNAGFTNTLLTMGATLPIVYNMKPTASGMWIGSTEQIFRH